MIWYMTTSVWKWGQNYGFSGVPAWSGWGLGRAGQGQHPARRPAHSQPLPVLALLVDGWPTTLSPHGVPGSPTQSSLLVSMFLPEAGVSYTVRFLLFPLSHL